MVAKLPNKCFSLVVKIGEQEGREKRVTQNDFLDLYKKTEDEQYELLTDIFEGNTKFDDLKKQRVCVSPFFNTLRTNFVGINSTRIELVWNTSFIICKSHGRGIWQRLQQFLESEEEQKELREQFREGKLNKPE